MPVESLGNQTRTLMHSPQDGFEMAGRLVERALQCDHHFPLLVDQLRIGSPSQPSVSGLQDVDYPTLASVSAGLGAITQLEHSKTVPLPAELVEQFAHMQLNCMMGLFPEIDRAWLTIDSDIFVWTYEYGADLAYFDGLSEAILGVGLVTPKPGIFQPHIRHLLCLTTPIEIVLLGVSFTRSSDDDSLVNSEMHLLPEPLFAIPSDNVYILTIVGTDIGRIFMGGKDGCLYELAYQAEDGWFSRKCRKINHSQSSLSFLVPSFISVAFTDEDPLVQIRVDNSSNTLYTLSEKRTIQVFDLGHNGLGMSRIANVNQSTIANYATNIARTIDKSNFYPIVHISAVERSESQHIHLVAISQSGARLYFTTCFNSQQNRPVTLQLVHVRLPPGFAANSPPQRPSKVHMALCSQGTALMASSSPDDSDFLWALSNDSFAFHYQLMETQSVIQIGAKTWALAEVQRSKSPFASHQLMKPPLLVTQHQDAPRRFVLLSPQGSHLFIKLRPVDQLKQLLIAHNGADNDAVKAFFAIHQVDQACATCLILACSYNPLEAKIADWATRALSLFGGDPHYKDSIAYNPVANTSIIQGSPVGWDGSRNGSPSIGSPSNFQPTHASSPVPIPGERIVSPLQPNPMLQRQYPAGSELQFSGRHNGLYLYFSRIVRPLWEERLVTEAPCKTPQGVVNYLGSAISCWELGLVVEQLTGLNGYLKRNASSNPLLLENLGIPQPIMNVHQDGQLQRRLQVDAQLQERISISSLQQLITTTLEVIGLWRVLCNHQFHAITLNLPKEPKNMLRVVTLKELVFNGKELSACLVTSLINHYLSDNAATDAISNRLREVCPNIYKAEDALFSKANELFLQSQRVSTKAEKEQLLSEAMKICKQIVPSVNLNVVCAHLQVAHHYSGIVDLCLSTAAKKDPHDVAVHYYHNGEQPEDQQGLQLFMARKECYKLILDTLDHLLSWSMRHPQSSNIPKSPGPPPPTDPSSVTSTDIQEQSENVLAQALKSRDELFHVSLYEWLFEKDMLDRLLEIKSPYLEPYLKRVAAQSDRNNSVMDLLWNYYEKTGDYCSAAKILSKLAEKRGTHTTLQKRIEYLARAVLCMKSMEARMGLKNEGQFLHELEEKMEVARIQAQIADSLLQMPIASAREALLQLNSELKDLTELYEEYASPFNLYKSQLAIVHMAGFYDPNVVESLWRNIIDNELATLAEQTPDVTVNALSQRLKSFGRLYSSSQKYFPLEFIIKYLEQKLCAQDLDSNWVFSTFQSVGVPIVQLLQVYNKLHRAKDPFWLRYKKPLHLLTVLSNLMGTYSASPKIVPAQERRQITTMCLDMIAGYIVELHTMEASDPSVISLVDSFRATQAKLERLS